MHLWTAAWSPRRSSARLPRAQRRRPVKVYVVDAAANNPGAAGGALTDSQGRLLGMLGKELRNATITARTLSTQDQAIDRLLVSLSLLGGEATEFLGVNGDDLADLLRSARPTAETLNAYSNELPCLLRGLDANREVMAQVLGGKSAGLRALVSVRSELPVYAYPNDLPGLPERGAPSCHGLPTLDQIPIPERGGEQ